MFLRLFATLILSAMSFGLAAETIKEGVSFAILGDPKYSSDFSHFDYVNPAAPKGEILLCRRLAHLIISTGMHCVVPLQLERRDSMIHCSVPQAMRLAATIH